MQFKNLPKVGDLITFSDRWDIIKEASQERQPVGLVINIISYNQLLENDTLGEVYGTLAYPITIDVHVSDLSRVFIVMWATTNNTVKSSYTWINEEWFYNESFIIISKA